MFSELLKSVVLVCTAIVAVSCSVREDRHDCPRYLTLNFDRGGIGKITGEGLSSLKVSLVSDSGESYEELLEMDRSFPSECVLPLVEGCGYVLNVSSPGEEVAFDAERGLRIPRGSDCPILFMHTENIPPTPGDISSTVLLRKRFASVFVTVRGLPEASRCCVFGNICGYGIDGMPITGAFEYEFAQDGDGTNVFRLPVQVDNSLQMAIGGKTEFIFPLGNYIVESGYDWSRDDLEDITISIDYSEMSCNLSIDKWSRTVYYDIII